jgi:hypothetical protein
MSSVTPQTSTLEQQVATALRTGAPLRGLGEVSIRDVRIEPGQPFDVSFQLQSGKNGVLVLGEIKSAFTPRTLDEIAPWIRRLRSLRPDVSVAVIAPALSAQAQSYCVANGIDFLDLAGNLSINLPGKFTMQRTGMRSSREPESPRPAPQVLNVFSGRSSRVLRVLLEKPKAWTVTEIVRELGTETARVRARFPQSKVNFAVSVGAVSKALASLEEQLLVRRRGAAALVTEPERALQQWAEKYRERYRWRLRQAFTTNNPFGDELSAIDRGIRGTFSGAYAFTGAAAVSKTAPFIDIDLIEVFIGAAEGDSRIRMLNEEPKVGAPLRFVYPYDEGVFMYALEGAASVVAPVQAYLDLYARGGRDLKQADYLLANVIRRQWAATDP